jgi:RNA processing factor Prp31
MGTRERAAQTDFSGVLEEEVEGQLKEAAQISMGTEISGEDLDNILALCDQVGWGRRGRGHLDGQQVVVLCAIQCAG